MKDQNENQDFSDNDAAKKDDNANVPGNTLYPATEDIYNKDKQEQDIDPEDITKPKESNEKNKTGFSNEKDFDGNMSGSDLDVPGSELDEAEENEGSEDEENNYYSLGGDDHNDLEEDKGE